MQLVARLTVRTCATLFLRLSALLTALSVFPAFALAPGANVSVAAGSFHTCGLLATGVVQCWGNNFNGQLGNNSSTPSPTPVAVSGLTTATQVSAGGNHSCARLASGGVQCWGFNGNGQLGDELGGSSALVPGPVVPGQCTMDIDGDGVVGTLSDLLMITRAGMGLSGTAVTQNAVGAQALRSTWPDIRAYLVRTCGMRGLAQ